MTTHVVTFSDESMSRAMDLCTESALRHGADRCWRFSPEAFQEFCPQVSLEGRGLGYWAWKPFIIDDLLRSSAVSDNDVVIYADAGIEFIDNVNYIVDRMDQDIFLFGNSWLHAHWCKRDIVEAVWPNYQKGEFHIYPQNNDSRVPFEDISPNGGVYGRDPWFPFGKQAQASVIFFRVNDHTRTFVKEWLDWCLFEGGRLIDDSPSRAPNHPEFQENRHDQAILTTMAYRDGIKLHWWPAMYNDGAFTYERGTYSDEGYPVLFHHHRRRNHEWEKVA